MTAITPMPADEGLAATTAAARVFLRNDGKGVLGAKHIPRDDQRLGLVAHALDALQEPGCLLQGVGAWAAAAVQ